MKMTNADDLRALGEDIINMHKDRKKWNSEFLETCKKNNQERAAEVAQLLAGFSGEDKERAAEVATLISEFAKEDKTRVAEVKELIAGFSAEKQSRAAEVAGLIAGFKKDREDAASAWKGLLTKMSAKEKKEVSIPEALLPKKRELSIEEKVLEFIEKHPEGVKVGEMEKPLGVVRMMLGRIAKTLLEEGKVRKEENLYFPL